MMECKFHKVGVGSVIIDVGKKSEIIQGVYRHNVSKGISRYQGRYEQPQVSTLR